MKDFEIREILRSTTLKKFISDSESKVVDELCLPVTKSRIDIAVLNGHLHGIEIKSASDTLARLPHQIEGYSKVFDYLTVVTEDKHYNRILDLLPDWVGLQVCIKTDQGFKVKTVRKSYYNRNKEGFFIAKLLWREEIISILDSREIHFKRKDTVWKLCELLEKSLTINDLSKTVRETLKIRNEWKVKEYYA